MSVGIAIHDHDWSAVEAWFDRKATEAGKPPGTLAYYGHSEVLAVSLDKEIVIRFDTGLDKIISEVFSNAPV